MSNARAPPSAYLAPPQRKLGLMTAKHTPWSAILHAGLTVLGFYLHRDALHTAGVTGFHPLAVGPGPVGLVEPCVSVGGGCSPCRPAESSLSLYRSYCAGSHARDGPKPSTEKHRKNHGSHVKHTF